jgi:penicillin-binding protein 1A
VDDLFSKIKNLEENAAEIKQSELDGVAGETEAPPAIAPVQPLRPKNRFFLKLRRLTQAKPSVEGARTPPQQRQNGRKPFHRCPLTWVIVALTGGAGVLAWGCWKVESTLPDVSDISGYTRSGTLTIEAADGTVLQQLGPATRDRLSYKQFPPRVVEAFIAAEDRRFYQHGGVDYQSIIRAVAKNLVSRDVVEGASTITQQLARIVYLNQERSLWRKVQEAFLAQKIEREMSKQKVLETYLNLVYLGSGAYGVADAAWTYFSKPVNQLTLSETATIAGLPPAPSDYSPLVNPSMARERRDVVLERMQEAGYITEAEAEAARSQPLKLKPGAPKKLLSDAPYFTTYVQQQLSKLVSKEQLELGGLRVETTLNSRWQSAAEKAIQQAIKVGAWEGFKQAALVSIDPATGEIRAMVGGLDERSGQFNRATQAQRQPGSAFKAILYSTAIATGISPYATYLDAPFDVDGYRPENYGRKYNGWMSLRDALTNSVNIVSVKLLIDVGFDPVIQTAHNMGIKSDLVPAYSLALGTSEVNLLELTNAYATLAANGVYTEVHGIRRIVNRKGEVLFDAQVKQKRAIDEMTVAIVTWMMQNVVNSGTGQAAQVGRPVAGKTGTSEEARDLWFIGFVPQLVTGVWLGNDDNTPTWSYSSTAASVWHDFMEVALKGMPVQNFPELPKNLDSRKGSIKAKPIHPRRSYTYDKSESSSSQSQKSAPARSYTPAEQAPRQESQSAPSPSPAEQPNTAPAQPPVAPPPPENSAPPELPPPVAPSTGPASAPSKP